MSTISSRPEPDRPLPDQLHRTKENRKVVALLSSFEREHFFPLGLEHSLAQGVSPDLHDVRDVSGNWDRFFDQHSPEVVIGGWDMPPLPPFAQCRSAQKKRLRYLCYVAGAVRNKVPRCWIEQGLMVTNWGASISNVVAESALMMALGALRCVASNQDSLHHQGGWKLPGRPEQSLFGRTVGIHGFGRVAQALVSLLRPFNVQIQTYAPGTPANVLPEFGVRECESLEELFATSEVLVEAAPLNPQTIGIVGRELLDLLPMGAVFINIGRGPVIVEQDLLDVASRRQLRVALDVYENEPLPADSPLRGRSDFLLMPHQSGPTLDRCRDAGAYALEQVSAYLEGRGLTDVITVRLWDQLT